MSKKNYYQLLHVSPQATAQEIKVAYRKLALKYHPDRNKGNTLHEAVFKEINEAYSILSNPEKRKFYNASIAVNTYISKHKRPEPLSSSSILQEAIRVKMAVEKANIFTINYDALFFKIKALLCENHLNVLLLEDNKKVIHQFIQQVLICLQPLAFSSSQTLFYPLMKLAGEDEIMCKEIRAFYQQKKREAFWQRYKMLLVLLITLLLCLLIYVL